MTDTSIMTIYKIIDHIRTMILSATHWIIKASYESNQVELGSELDSVFDSVEKWYGESIKDCGRAEIRLEKQVTRISFQALFRNK